MATVARATAIPSGGSPAGEKPRRRRLDASTISKSLADHAAGEQSETSTSVTRRRSTSISLGVQAKEAFIGDLDRQRAGYCKDQQGERPDPATRRSSARRRRRAA